MENKLKTICKNFASDATLHGPQKVLTSKKGATKVLWTIIFLVFASFMIYFLTKTFESYLSYSVYTKTDKKVSASMPFPSVTVCSTGLLRKSALNSTNLLLHKYFSNQSNAVNLHLDGIRVVNAFRFQHMYFNDLEGIKKASFEGSEIFLNKIVGSCVFGINQLCKYPKDFKHIPIDYIDGYCYTFNPNGTYKQQSEGSYFGLSMMMFINQSDIPPLLSVDQGGGAVVVIHPHDEFPFPSQNGILLKPGTLSRISIRKIVTKRKQSPYPSKCTNGEGIKLIYPGRYTRSNCKRSCFAVMAYKQCGNLDYFYAKHANIPKRQLNESESICLLNSIGSLMEQISLCNCPVSCEEERYNPDTSHTIWPSSADFPYYKTAFAAALDLSETDVTTDFVYKNFLKLNVFFEDLGYEEIAEWEEWTYQKLLSDIGGQTGIWIGASAFSLVEIFMLLLQLIKSCLNRNNDRATTVNETQALPKC